MDLRNSSLFAVSSSQIAVSMGCRDVFIGDCEGTLAITPLSLGAPREVEPNVVSADWAPGGSEMAVVREVAGQYQVEFPLGKVIYKAGTWIDSIRVSPRGNVVGFVQYGTGGDRGKAIILDREGRKIAESSRAFPSIEGLAWAPSGYEVWFGATRWERADGASASGYASPRRQPRMVECHSCSGARHFIKRSRFAGWEVLFCAGQGR